MIPPTLIGKEVVRERAAVAFEAEWKATVATATRRRRLLPLGVGDSAGFEEALASSIPIQIEANLIVRVASIPGLMLLKLVA
jgi:hypothetical protein